MSVDRAGEIPRRNQLNMPDYFHKDRVGRDEFLSQIGHFAEDIRTIFSWLCDMWEPDIPYAKFFAKAGQGHINVEAGLNTLMEQLERGKCGVISRTVKDGKLKKDRIILTDRDSPRFWYWSIENAWQVCRIVDDHPFPTVSGFRERGSFPDDILQPLSLGEISKAFIGKHRDEVLLYVLPDIDGAAIIVTPATLDHMIEAARSKIRGILANSPLQSVLSRLLGTVVSNLQRFLLKDDNVFWNKLTKAIIVHKKDLLVRKPNLSEELFMASKILAIYTRNELDEDKRQKKEEGERQEAIKGILVQVAQAKELIVGEDEFKAYFNSYKKQWPDLEERFVSDYMTNAGRLGLPQVVRVGDDYLHRDHLYPLFKLCHNVAVSDLRHYYLDVIERILRTNNQDNLTTFAGIDAFTNDIQNRLNTDFPVLHQFLAAPRLVYEGIVHYATKVLKITDMEKVNILLRRYFEGESIRFKELHRLFKLSPRIMFNEAFGRLGSFRRLILKFFGRYESHIHVFNAVLLPQDKGGTRPTSDAAEEMVLPERVRPDQARHEVGERVTEAAVRRRKQAKGMSHRYSMKQQNNAWSEFRDAYKHKKKDKT